MNRPATMMAKAVMATAMFTAGVASAQGPQRDTVYFTLPPSPAVLAAHLFGDEPNRETRVLTRSISFKKPAPVPAEPARTVAMPILFHFGKTTITSNSRQFLNNVGEMLVATSSDHRALVVEGHTDSVGSEAYNLGLSERRAHAIKDYLVNHFGISPDRLVPVGKGESTLYNKHNPKSAENRRVEFLPLRS